MYAKVLLRTKQPEIDRAFDYRVPEELRDGLCPGMRVLVPFGPRNTRTEGYVLELADHTFVPGYKVKSVLARLEAYPLFSWEMLELARWMKEEYYCTLSQCLQTMMPAGIQAKTDWLVCLAESAAGFPADLTPREAQTVAFIKNNGGVCKQSALDRSAQATLKALKEKGAIRFRQETQNAQYRHTERRVFLALPGEEALASLGTNARTASQRAVIAALMAEDGLGYQALLDTAKVGASTINTLKSKGFLAIRQEEVRRIPREARGHLPAASFQPTPDQEQVLRALEGIRREKRPKPVLLHGVTGSGKTEIYLQTIEKVLAEGKQAIVLVPEISLTPQMVERFVGRFGDRVAVTHSRLSLAERHDQWKKARLGEASVMIGPRSAVFAPFPNLGLIIMDEEHEHSYRSELTPKYHAAAVAKKRCELTGALLLLGSATPSVDTYYQAAEGKIHLLELPKRIGESGLPSVSIVDMRLELAEGNRSIFSLALAQGLEETLAAGKQAILFLNRRGYSTFVSCRKCGYVATCDNCAVSYTYHAAEQKLRCHYCGKEQDAPKVCPACGSPYIRYFGTGTQRAEEAVKKRFPQARVLRMDADTTRKKDSYLEILSAFGRGDADILIGTQMIAKGHDFPGVTLVGVLAADLSLHFGDFRSAETTFQLLTQVAGRAGRGNDPGRVYIQTYSPEHYAVQYAAKQDYPSFYREETALRMQMDYPPFSHIASLLVTGAEEKSCIEASRELADILLNDDALEVLGPAPAVISKLKGVYRWRILVKAKEEARLRESLLNALAQYKGKKPAGVLVDMTLDPSVIV